MFEWECILLFILIYSINPVSSQICGQASGEDITYLYNYSDNDSPTSIYTPTVSPAEPSLTCKSTVKAGVLKNETFLCNESCVTTMTPLIRKTNATISYNYTNDAFVPAGFELNHHIQPVICAKRSQLCGATKALYWNKNAGELSLTNDYDPFDQPICFIWADDSSQYQEMSKTQKNQCPTLESTKKLRRKKRSLPFNFWEGGTNQSSEPDQSRDNDWMNNNTASKAPCTSNSSLFDWFPWSRSSKQTESTTQSTTFTTANQPSTNQPSTQTNQSTTRLVTSTTVAVRTSVLATKVTFPTEDPDNITRRRPRDLSNELNDTILSSSTAKNTSSSSSTSISSSPGTTTAMTTTTTTISRSSGGTSASSSSSTSTTTTTTTFRSSSQSGSSIPFSSAAILSSSSTTRRSSPVIASSSTSTSSAVTQSGASKSSIPTTLTSRLISSAASSSSSHASLTTIHSSSSTRLSSSSANIAISSGTTNSANNVTVPTLRINQTIGPAGTSPSIPSSATSNPNASSSRSIVQATGPGGASAAGISGNLSFSTTTLNGTILGSSISASSSTTASLIVQTTTSNINSKKSAICSALSNLESSNTISLSAVTSILSQYNVTLDDALTALNLTLAQVSTMSVSDIIDRATAACQGHVSSVITLRTRHTTNGVGGITYNAVTYDNGNGSTNTNSTWPNYGGGRTRYYQNHNRSSSYDDGGDTLILVPVPDRSYSQQDREDRDSDNRDYWYDGTTYQYNHRIWRWVLLGVFCALIVAIAFALLCFACYRPYRASTTTTIVTPLPVTEKIYTSSGQVDVPPLPISPMPAYSNAATLRL